jgi:hypothetical protein
MSASLAIDDPWLSMTDAERRAQRKARREKFYNPKPNFLPPDAEIPVVVPIVEEPQEPQKSHFDSWVETIQTMDVTPADPANIKVEEVIKTVLKYFPDVRKAELLSPRRTAKVVKPRQIAMYVAKTVTKKSLPDIGRRLGGRDHTTILHALRKLEKIMPTNPCLLPDGQSDIAWYVATIINDLGHRDV